MTRAAPVVVAVAVVVSGCELNLTSPSPGSVTSTNTINIDLPPTPPTPPTPTNPIPPAPGTPVPTPIGAIPSYGASVLAATAASYGAALAASCQTTHGAAAWTFLDTLLIRLRQAAGDPRWGYVCRGGNCSDPSGDVIAYLASGAAPAAGARGTFGIDVIGNHCGAAPVATWQEMPYDPSGVWSGTRF
jgi:hypothetical protein